jgi:hypothetical protein
MHVALLYFYILLKTSVSVLQFDSLPSLYVVCGGCNETVFYLIFKCPWHMCLTWIIKESFCFIVNNDMNMTRDVVLLQNLYQFTSDFEKIIPDLV